MRRPGYLGDLAAEFTQKLSTEEQKALIKQRYASLRQKNAQIGPRSVTPNINRAAFNIVPGESINARLARLEAAGLYTPGSVMTGDYANLVNYGTTDKQMIAEINRKRQQWQDAENLKRYKTTDIKQIVGIVEGKRGEREAIWQRVYGTSNPDVIYKMDPAKRQALCQRDPACAKISGSLFNGLGNFGAFSNLLKFLNR